MAAPSEWVALARVSKTQGRRGELAVELLTDIPGRFEGLVQVWLWRRDGVRQAFALLHHWPHKQGLVLGLEGLDDLSAAEGWVGAEVQVPAGERAPAPAGRYFRSDLVGCRVYDGARLLGVVEDLETVEGAPDLLHVRGVGGGEILIPFAAAYLESISLAAGEVHLVLPEGLADLNAI